MSEQTQEKELLEIALPIEGMTCAACATRIERRLSRTDGVRRAAVSYATEEALVGVEAEKQDFGRLVQAVEQAGYRVRTVSAEARVRPDGERPASDVVRDTERVPGVLRVETALDGEGIVVRATYVRGATDLDVLARALGAEPDRPVGTASGEADALEAEHLKRYRDLRKRFFVAVVLSLPVVVVSMAHGALDFPGSRWLLWALSTPVVAWSGAEFFVLAWRAARHRTTDMNTLVAVGVGTAYVASAAAVLAPSFFEATGGHADVYFEAAAVIVTLILLGRLLEERAKGRTGSAIRALMKLQPDEARVRRGGVETVVPVRDVRIGDEVVIRPGERVPIDGEILTGGSAVDESMVTGEPIPAEKGPGDPVVAGTMNTTGALVCLVTRVGRDTLLRQIVEMVRHAQADKPPIQRLADRIAAVFVPAVIGIALVTAATWWVLGPEPHLNHAILRFVTVMIIACPCALGLATPTAIVVATGLAARLGILVREGSSIEQAGRIDRIALDKTGTLTEGRPAVAAVLPAREISRERLLGVAASAEHFSEHPIARAILEEAQASGLFPSEPKRFESETGLGVRAQVDGRAVVLGRRRFLEESGVVLPPEEEAPAAETEIWVAEDGAVVGRILVADRVRDTSARAVALLRGLGVEPVMLTGDSPRAAAAVARTIGISDVRAGILPHEKADVVRALRDGGHRVGMVGDGINDAPALAQADVGIAMGSGTDIAVQASDMTLMRPDPVAVVDAVRLSRRTLRVIRQNLFFAFVYNVILIPVAAGVLYPAFGLLLNPMIASAAMAASSVSVVSNSLRLRRFPRTNPDPS
jgi:Cu+-exporting ATPase